MAEAEWMGFALDGVVVGVEWNENVVFRISIETDRLTLSARRTRPTTSYISWLSYSLITVELWIWNWIGFRCCREPTCLLHIGILSTIHHPMKNGCFCRQPYSLVRNLWRFLLFFFVMTVFDCMYSIPPMCHIRISLNEHSHVYE